MGNILLSPCEIYIPFDVLYIIVIHKHIDCTNNILTRMNCVDAHYTFNVINAYRQVCYKSSSIKISAREPIRLILMNDSNYCFDLLVLKTNSFWYAISIYNVLEAMYFL